MVAKNKAFMFIKPHAVTDKTIELVRKTLEEKGIKILESGSLTAEEIDSKKLIDQHYYAIASKATILKPSELNVPADKFKEKFDIDWTNALDSGKVFNAMDACQHLGITVPEIEKLWRESERNNNCIKFGGGFYCGRLDMQGKEPIFVFNGFFMTMRSKFTNTGASIYYYSLEFDAAALSWEEFRHKVLGETNPTKAPPDSLRGMILKDYKELGLAGEPSVADNCVHASASPFEGLAEHANWLGVGIEKDGLGSALLDAGIPKDTIKKWFCDPQVICEGAKVSLFDAVEDTDYDVCLGKLISIHRESLGASL
eukprot:m.62426 g.62426  ORF g.62426 m.62426 type:complete len:312 (+) comp11508_c0_seq1:203-1138(+)